MPTMRIGLDNTKAIVCEACGNDTFQEAVYLRTVSKLLTGQPEDGLIPFSTFVCTKCGHVNKQFALRPIEEEKSESGIVGSSHEEPHKGPDRQHKG